MLFIGMAMPNRGLEGYVPTGEVRLPRKGEYFWSDRKDAVIRAICDETHGYRIIMKKEENVSQVRPVQPRVRGHLSLLRKPDEGSVQEGPQVPEVPSGEGPDGRGGEEA